MRKIELLLDKYGESHRHPTNKAIHWICVPLILFSITGLIGLVPYTFTDSGPYLNWATVIGLCAALYYMSLSVPLMLGFLSVFAVLLWVNGHLSWYCSQHGWSVGLVLLVIFTLAWIGQFIGHKIEGKKPSFLDDLQFLLIGPAWLLHFLYGRFGIRY